MIFVKQVKIKQPLGGNFTKISSAFTLIELLAIIVILAIIAVITVPIILNIIENSRKGAVTDSAYGYHDAISKYYVSKLSEEPNYNFSGIYSVDELKTLGVSVSGQEPTEGWVTIEKGGVVDYSIKIGDYVVDLDESTGNVSTTKNGDIESSPANWFTYSSNGDGTVSITGFNTTNYDGSVTDIIFPSKDTEGNIVTKIGFSSNNTITSVFIPNTVTEIKSGSFMSNSSLTKVSLSEGLKRINTPAFMNSSLIELVIPDSVEMIGNGCFANVYTLKTLYLGSGLITLNGITINAGDPSALEVVYNRSNLDLELGNYLGNRTGYKIININ